MNEQYVPFTVGGALKRGWELFKDNAVFLIGYQVVLYVLTALLAATMQRQTFWHLVIWVLIIIAKMGFYNSAILIAQGIEPAFDQLYKNWRLFFSWVIANFIFGAMFIIGLIFLIVPGLYVWARYGLFPFFLLDKKLGPIAALEQTGTATTGIRWEIFLLLISCLLLNVLGLLFFGIGILITAPVTMLAVATVYHQIKQKGIADTWEKIK